jgi:hypothetical protein
MAYTKEQLEEDIARARARLKALESLYEAEFGDVPVSALEPRNTLPYAGIRPIRVISSYLRERGETPFETLLKDMKDGGCSYGAKNQTWAITRSVVVNAKYGKLLVNGKSVKNKEVELKPDDIISLAKA